MCIQLALQPVTCRRKRSWCNSRAGINELRPSRNPGSVHCLRLRKPRLQSVRTFSYQVIDGWRLRADQCVPCASMARCMSYCNVHQPCRGFTCSRTHGTCYAAIDYTPQFSTSGVRMQKPHPRWRQFCGGVLRDGILLPQVDMAFGKRAKAGLSSDLFSSASQS